MTQHLHLPRAPAFSGTLAFAQLPGGELHFEDGEATVSDDVDLDGRLDRYPHLERGSPPEPTEAGTQAAADTPDTDADADVDADEPAAEAESEADAPFDPREMTVDEVRAAVDEYDPSDDERQVLADLEDAGDDRTTALDAINAPEA